MASPPQTPAATAQKAFQELTVLRLGFIIVHLSEAASAVVAPPSLSWHQVVGRKILQAIMIAGVMRIVDQTSCFLSSVSTVFKVSSLSLWPERSLCFF